MVERENEVVLFENKVYYPHQAQVIGDDVEFVTFEENQNLEEPLYTPQVKLPEIATKDLPTVTFHRKFQQALLEHPGLLRTVALVGHTGHGKTSLVDMLIQSTHTAVKDMFTNTHHLEISRGVTMSTKAINLVLPDSRGKSYSVNVIDTPGHPDFQDQLDAGLGLVDAVMLVLDICEPLLPTDLMAIEQALASGKRLRICLNKLDRLVVEQQRNCISATTRIFFMLDEINRALESYGGTAQTLDDVLFASAKYRWCFTLDSIGSLYSQYAENSEVRAHLATPRVFADYALEPIFKMYHGVLSGEEQYIRPIFKGLDLQFQAGDLKHSADALLVRVFQQYFMQPTAALVDILHGTASCERSSAKSLELHVSRYLYHGGELYALARVTAGTLCSGQELLFGEQSAVVSSVMLPHAQYNMQIPCAFAGNIVLVGGISSLSDLAGYTVGGGAEPTMPEGSHVLKVGVEPFHPAKSDDFRESLEFLRRTWPGLRVKVEGTGEHILCGPGELYLDSALYALRHDFRKLEIRVSYPTAQFAETATDYSTVMCPTQTPNTLNQVTMLATRFPEGTHSTLKKYGWSNLEVDSIISISPVGVLVNEATLPKDNNLPQQDLIAGFEEYMSEGPLCGEPVRNVRMNVAQFEQASLAKDRSSGQVIPTVRRACAAAHMVAEPRLLEPVYRVVCLGIEQSRNTLENILKSRRGSFSGQEAVPGTNFFLFYGRLPVLDSFGFETQVRGHCHDLVQVSLLFERWDLVPGNPLDSDAGVPKLTKAAAPSLARDIVLRLRKRKGLSREPELAALLDYDVAQSMNLV